MPQSPQKSVRCRLGGPDTSERRSSTSKVSTPPLGPRTKSLQSSRSLLGRSGTFDNISLGSSISSLSASAKARTRSNSCIASSPAPDGKLRSDSPHVVPKSSCSNSPKSIASHSTDDRRGDQPTSVPRSRIYGKWTSHKGRGFQLFRAPRSVGGGVSWFSFKMLCNPNTNLGARAIPAVFSKAFSSSESTSAIAKAEGAFCSPSHLRDVGSCLVARVDCNPANGSGAVIQWYDMPPDSPTGDEAPIMRQNVPSGTLPLTPGVSTFEQGVVVELVDVTGQWGAAEQDARNTHKAVEQLRRATSEPRSTGSFAGSPERLKWSEAETQTDIICTRTEEELGELEAHLIRQEKMLADATDRLYEKQQAAGVSGKDAMRAAVEAARREWDARFRDEKRRLVKDREKFEVEREEIKALAEKAMTRSMKHKKICEELRAQLDDKDTALQEAERKLKEQAIEFRRAMVGHDENLKATAVRTMSLSSNTDMLRRREVVLSEESSRQQVEVHQAEKLLTIARVWYSSLARMRGVPVGQLPDTDLVAKCQEEKAQLEEALAAVRATLNERECERAILAEAASAAERKAADYWDLVRAREAELQRDRVAELEMQEASSRKDVEIEAGWAFAQGVSALRVVPPRNSAPPLACSFASSDAYSLSSFSISCLSMPPPSPTSSSPCKRRSDPKLPTPGEAPIPPRTPHTPDTTAKDTPGNSSKVQHMMQLWQRGETDEGTRLPTPASRGTSAIRSGSAPVRTDVARESPAKCYTYAQLKQPGSKLTRAEIDVTSREKYLSREEFIQVLGMTPEEFEALPTWKRGRKKQEVGLF